MEFLWTLDGDETSWAGWAQDIVQAPATAMVKDWIDKARPMIDTLELKTGRSEQGESRNWLAASTPAMSG